MQRRRTTREEGAAVELGETARIRPAPGGGTGTVVPGRLTHAGPGFRLARHRAPSRPHRTEVLELALWAAGAVPSPPAADRAGQRLAVGPGCGPRPGDDALARALRAVRGARQRQFLGRYAEATALADTALLWARRAGSDPARVTALRVLGVSLWQGPEPVAAVVPRLRALLEEHGEGRPSARLALVGPLAVLYGMRESWAPARTALVLARAVAMEVDPGAGGVLSSVLAARVESLAGRAREAVHLMEEAADTADALGLDRLREAVRWAVVRLLTDAGRYEEAARWLPGNGPRAPRAGDEHRSTLPVGGAGPTGLTARIAAAGGCAGEAMVLAGRAVDEAAATDSPTVQALARLDQAEVFGLAGRHDEARRAVSLAGCGFARKGHVPGVSDAAARHAALAPARAPGGRSPGGMPPISVPVRDAVG
ncbi:hypothetical protein [Streptomyces sp. NPDC014734]|uniref:hypothetical protein n=1 Tax=Streptomyces sp. NPDC014734 TaxID=3364886 RepID=UPI0036FD2D5F